MTTDLPPSTSDEIDLLLKVYAELGATSRWRSAAASVGAFRAVAWGVAAVPQQRYVGTFWTNPAVVAAISVLFVAIVVTLKLISERIKFVRIRQHQIKVARLIAKMRDDVIPVAWWEKEVEVAPMLARWERLMPGGTTLSIFVVITAASGTIGFCLVLLFSN